MDAKATVVSALWRAETASDGVFDFGMQAKDGPVTWEIPPLPRETPADREPVTSP